MLRCFVTECYSCPRLQTPWTRTRHGPGRLPEYGGKSVETVTMEILKRLRALFPFLLLAAGSREQSVPGRLSEFARMHSDRRKIQAAPKLGLKRAR
jgi:hypothetical protein